MGILDEIKKDANKSFTTLSNPIEEEITVELNKLFYLEKDIPNELKFLKSVMTRGQETTERKGLHASAVIVSDKKFCYRQQVLSLLYKQKQGEQINVGLRRIFSEGDAVHEKWQRLFIRGGLCSPLDCDFSRFSEEYELSYTPDIICTLFGRKMVVEIKSVNTYQFKKMLSHASGKKQLQLYMHLTGIPEGFVLCEDKNDQNFKVYYYKYDEAMVKPFVERLENIQQHKNKLINKGRLVKRSEACTDYECKMAQTCPMREVCYGKSKERL
uniref:Exonuclease n=1 Tax=Dulem virus 36 TaxID=3145754 RepID=A0AAU8AYE8_9CAUD